MSEFFDKYVTEEYLPRSDQCPVPEITAEELSISINGAKNTAAGADDLYPVDLKLLPREGLACLAAAERRQHNELLHTLRARMAVAQQWFTRRRC